MQQQLDAWYANAQAIATLLNSVDPQNWPLDVMQTMMDQHLALTTSEAQDYVAGNYAASVSDYEAVHLEILSMADMLSAGIIAQFPSAFAPGH